MTLPFPHFCIILPAAPTRVGRRGGWSRIHAHSLVSAKAPPRLPVGRQERGQSDNPKIFLDGKVANVIQIKLRESVDSGHPAEKFRYFQLNEFLKEDYYV